MELRTKEGIYQLDAEKSWDPVHRFRGTMGELLCAIEENREPWNNAKDNLKSLQLCFAACASADRGKAIAPRSVTRLEKI